MCVCVPIVIFYSFIKEACGYLLSVYYEQITEGVVSCIYLIVRNKVPNSPLQFSPGLWFFSDLQKSWEWSLFRKEKFPWHPWSLWTSKRKTCNTKQRKSFLSWNSHFRGGVGDKQIINKYSNKKMSGSENYHNKNKIMCSKDSDLEEHFKSGSQSENLWFTLSPEASVMAIVCWDGRRYKQGLGE